jgi:putative GTP pyrophosphokinase
MDTVIIPEGRRGLPDQHNLRKEYEELLPLRNLIVRELELRIEEAVAPLYARPRIKGRVKSFESYFKKYIRFLKNEISSHYSGITDLIGIRIICPFLEDLVTV